MQIELETIIPAIILIVILFGLFYVAVIGSKSRLKKQELLNSQGLIYIVMGLALTILVAWLFYSSTLKDEKDYWLLPLIIFAGIVIMILVTSLREKNKEKRIIF